MKKAMKKFSTLGVLLASALPGGAEEVVISDPSLGLSTTEILVLVGLIFTILLVIVVKLLNNMLEAFYHKKHEIPYEKKEVQWDVELEAERGLWEKILSLKPISEEKNIVLKHKYDGIEELNNPIPGWFNFLFYGTIIFSVIYLFIYEVSGIGGRQRDEYVQEVRAAELEQLANLKKLGATIDENTVVINQATEVLENGALMYNANCKSCHGEFGEGTVGPNLTDEYWIHGGSVNDIFRTIKYGVVDKGMVAWGKNMSPKTISDISNYIVSLRNSNPAGAKEAQGEKYIEEVELDAL